MCQHNIIELNGEFECTKCGWGPVFDCPPQVAESARAGNLSPIEPVYNNMEAEAVEVLPTSSSVSAEDKFILDACCGGRMFWFDKKHPKTLYVDIRKLPAGMIESSPKFEVNPDKVMDFRKLDLPDKSFKLVVWDPPHLKSLDLNSWIAAKYGVLDPKTWRTDILQGFNECWRVLEDYGVLIFKWSISHDNRPKRDVSIAQILELLPVKPLFGHPSGSKMNTVWMCFMKIPENENRTTEEENHENKNRN